jgi:hypothetical protein
MRSSSLVNSLHHIAVKMTIRLHLFISDKNTRPSNLYIVTIQKTLFFGLFTENFKSFCGCSDHFKPVLCIRISFNADPVPDQAFYLNIGIRIQGFKPMRIHGDPDL